MAGKPDENGIEGLPEEWGRIHIPDDAAELEPLTQQIQRELRKARRAEMRLPYTVLAITVIITLISMFVIPRIGTPGRVEPTPTCTTDCNQPSNESSPAESTGL